MSIAYSKRKNYSKFKRQTILLPFFHSQNFAKSILRLLKKGLMSSQNLQNQYNYMYFKGKIIALFDILLFYK